MTETWRPACDQRYEVSSEGRVRRIGRSPLKPRKHSNGYSRVSLGAGNDSYVHRLVCFAFHGEPPSSDCHADHLNGNRSDNRASNLRWLSPDENRALRRHRRGSAQPQSKLTEAEVKLIRSKPRTRGSDAKIAAHFGVARETIRDIRNGKGWTHVG